MWTEVWLATQKPALRPGSGWSAAKRCGRWCGVAVVLLALLALEMVLFGDRIRSDMDVLRAAGRPASGAVSNHVVTPRQVAAPAPMANGPVRAVDLRPLSRCVPGADCETRVQVWLPPQAVAREVGWTFEVTDRCTGAIQVVPGGSMVVAEGGRLVVVSVVRLPSARALALTAVTAVPARTASPALLIPSKAGC